MAWGVDTCVVLDILEADPAHGAASAALVDRFALAGLVVCPVTYIELAPAFDGDRAREDFFLEQINIDFRESWTRRDTENAHAAWHRHVQARRRGKSARRPVADILIGSFAERFEGLLTRNPGDFKAVFPKLAMQP